MGGRRGGIPRLVRATDRRDEITACAHWIRGLLDENPLFEKKAETRIGVIVPDMGAVRSDVERIFRRVLMPETDDVFAPSARMPFEFSLGHPLGDVPVIRAALLLLRWAAGPLSEEEMSWLLLSGYLGDRAQGSAHREQDTGLRAQGYTGNRTGGSGHMAQGGAESDVTADPSTNHPIGPTPGALGTPAMQPSLRMTSMEEYLALGSFDAALRNSGSLSLEISLRNMLREMRRFPALAGVHAQLEDLQKMAAVNHVMDEVRTPGRWVDLAQLLLDQAGWRGAQRRDEIDFQARARWERLLDEVALLDFDGRRVGYREFVGVLETQAGEAIFAAESHGAPVQVMGALEASGQQFDAVWFLGADDQAWPARGRLHPLLPNDVQRRAGMPHATAEDDWELARVVTRRIAASVLGPDIDLLPTLSPKARKDGAPGVVVGPGSDPGPRSGTWGTQGCGRTSVVFSHAERDKDGELRASPLIAEVIADDGAPSRGVGAVAGAAACAWS